MSLAVLAKWSVWQHSLRKKFFEDPPSSQVTIRASGAFFWRGFLGRAEGERGIAANVDY
jgi:hypothetical protein